MRRQMKSKDEGDEEESHVREATVDQPAEEAEEVEAAATDNENAIDAAASTPCTMCTDEPSPYMTMTGKTCPDVYLQQKCANDPTNNWQVHQYCTQTCYDLGIGYDGVECCDPPSTDAPTGTPTDIPTSTPTASPASLSLTTKEPTASPTASPSVSDDPTELDVAGEDRIHLLHSNNSHSSDDKKNQKPMQSKKSKSDDEVQNDVSVPKYEFSPGCSSLRRGKLYTKGEEITIAFKYMVLYDGELDLSHLLVGLEDNLQTYAEHSMINCPGSSYVVNNGATWIDGVQIDLPSQPEAGCGVDENDQTCSMLDGYVTIYIRQTAEASGLKATQDALKALRVGMADGLVGDTDGISKLSFLGGISMEGDGLGYGTPDNIPASARIGSAPVGNMEEKNGLSVLGIGFLVVAAIGFVLVGAVLRRRVKFKLKKRALADSDSDASLDNEVRTFDAPDRDDDLQQRDTVGQSLSFAESLASCHGDSPAACGAQDSSDDNESIAEDKLMSRANTASFDTAGSGGGMQSIAIHQYCESPTCTICRSYKKPVFANMKYKVEDTDNEISDEERDDSNHRRYENCPTSGMVAKTFAKISSRSDCYLCA